MITGLTRTIAILSAIVLGALLPQAHVFVWLVRWNVIVMLFLVFLQTRLSRDALHRSHGWLLAANFGIGFAAWGAGALLGGHDVALAAFFCGITPTAIAAPVITSFLGGQVAYVVAAFMVSNLTIAASLPVVLPFVLGHPTPDAFARVAGSVGGVFFAPFVGAWLVRKIHPPAAAWPKKLGNVTFAIWCSSLLLITANGSDFLRSQANLPRTAVLEIAFASFLVCAAGFALGRVIGGRDYASEASQSLGQKNTTFTIYLALAYASPLVALGPTFYVLWHNLWNSWQLHRHHVAASAAAKNSPP